MRSQRSLAGHIVAITRPRAQSQAIADALKSLGARFFITPAIRVAQPRSFAALDGALRSPRSYDALVFTSANGVESFFKRARATRIRPSSPKRLFAVGPATAAALKKYGWKATAIPEKFNGSSLKRLFGPVKGLRVLFPRALKGREELPRFLRRAGARLDVVEAYRTLPDERGLRRLKSLRRADAIVFASPSAVKNVFEKVGWKKFNGCAAVSIGPVTTAALKKRGAKIIVEAKQATSEGIAAALKDHFARQS